MLSLQRKLAIQRRTSFHLSGSLFRSLILTSHPRRMLLSLIKFLCNNTTHVKLSNSLTSRVSPHTFLSVTISSRFSRISVAILCFACHAEGSRAVSVLM